MHPNGCARAPTVALASKDTSRCARPGTGPSSQRSGASITTLQSGPADAPLSRVERRDRTASALAALAVTTPGAGQADLRDHLVRVNMGVARSIAGRYANRGIDEEDLLQVAYLGLTRAARDFDTTRDDDFLAYAVPTMRGEVKKYFRDHGWTVRPPRRVQETQALLNRAEGELTQQIGRTPTTRELAEHVDATVREVVEALAADGCFAPTSLDKPLGGRDTGGDALSLGDLLAEVDSEQPAAEARAALGPVVRRLSDRDRRILYLRFFEECTQQEIADEIGVTQMQVSRLLAKILAGLRRDLTGLRRAG